MMQQNAQEYIGKFTLETKPSYKADVAYCLDTEYKSRRPSDANMRQ